MGVNLYVEQLFMTWEEIEYMEHVSYDSVVVNLLYAMVFTWPDISHVVGVLSRYILMPTKEQ